MRVIAGLWRGRRIRTPRGRATRPTADRVREALFSILGPVEQADVLDLFAGSGALGIEALSRGAERVVMVDNSRTALEALKRSADILRAERLDIVGRDGLQFLAGSREAFDLVFLDPPYGAELLPKLFPLLPDRLKPGATVYFETDRAAPPPPGWEIIKESRAGAVRFQLAQLAGETSHD